MTDRCFPSRPAAADRGPDPGAGLLADAAAAQPAQVLQRRVHAQPHQQPLQRGQAAPGRGAGRHQGPAAPCQAGAVSLSDPRLSSCCCVGVLQTLSVVRSMSAWCSQLECSSVGPSISGLCPELGRCLNVDWSPPCLGSCQSGLQIVCRSSLLSTLVPFGAGMITHGGVFLAGGRMQLTPSGASAVPSLLQQVTITSPHLGSCPPPPCCLPGCGECTCGWSSLPALHPQGNPASGGWGLRAAFEK